MLAIAKSLLAKGHSPLKLQLNMQRCDIIFLNFNLIVKIIQAAILERPLVLYLMFDDVIIVAEMG